MLLARGGEEAGPGTTQTQQNLGMLQNKWASLNTKMDDRRVRLCGHVEIVVIAAEILVVVVNFKLLCFPGKAGGGCFLGNRFPDISAGHHQLADPS